MTDLQKRLAQSKGFADSLKPIGGYMACNSAANFVVNTTQSLIERKINGNILLKSGLNAVQSAGIETLASSLCHEIGASYPQSTRTILDEIKHKLFHGLGAVKLLTPYPL